jgi:LuxR family maltose regulon positive regulatory protein
MRNKGNLSRVEACLSATLYDQNRLEEALQHAQKGVHYLQWWPSHNHITTAYSYLGQVLLGMGRLDEAAEAIRRAEQEQHKGQVLPTVLSLVEKLSIQLWVKRGNWDLLGRWLAVQDITVPDSSRETRLYNEYEDWHRMSLARAWIAKGRKEVATKGFEQAFQLLSQIEIPAKRSHWIHSLIEILLLQAVALHEMEKKGVSGTWNAMDYLTYSLKLGLPGGYLRIYLQEGVVVAEMLQSWLKSPLAQSNHADLKPIMVKDLLDQFGIDLPTNTSMANSNLIEPLTEREQEVLQLLALGLSNKEMAQRMVVSEGTVKTHVHNLIGKLGAQSRTHVLARAKELELL